MKLSGRKIPFIEVSIFLVVIVTLCSLGLWQLDRLSWKNELIKKIEDRSMLPVIQLPDNLDDSLEFRRVSITGNFARGQAFRFPGKPVNGKVEDLLFAAIKLTDGRNFIIELDSIPFGASIPPLPATQVFEGTLRSPSQPTLFTPKNNPEKNQWFFVDPEEMLSHHGRHENKVTTFYLTKKNWKPVIVNNHLNYAFTWFSLAGAFIIIFFFFRQNRKKTN